ncbi:hypothetical protein LZ31DRAFT_156614 [Colletotrichum somersetense]|nr:hypothetical protein LZ31DRAFT_156614 [Colletotrichum somersetense]
MSRYLLSAGSGSDMMEAQDQEPTPPPPLVTHLLKGGEGDQMGRDNTMRRRDATSRAPMDAREREVVVAATAAHACFQLATTYHFQYKNMLDGRRLCMASWETKGQDPMCMVSAKSCQDNGLIHRAAPGQWQRLASGKRLWAKECNNPCTYLGISVRQRQKATDSGLLIN